MKTTVTKDFNGCKIEVIGVFTPYYSGVRYHRDGSGTPPEPEMFEIESIKQVEGNLIPFVDTIEAFYDKKIENILEAACSTIESILERKLTDGEVRRLKYWNSNNESFTEDMSNSIADDCQKQFEEELTDYDYETYEKD